MQHVLPELPYAKDALEPHMSQETLEYHHGKHHATYVEKLNGLIAGSEFEEMPLEAIIDKATGGLFNNAAQTWNHTFFWHCLSPNGGGEPSGELAAALKRDFGSVDDFREQFSQTLVTLFGSGWGWLVKDERGLLSIESLGNAGNPLTSNKLPLLTCDVWEHAYYIDWRNARPKYVEAFWKLVNWDFVAENYARDEPFTV